LISSIDTYSAFSSVGYGDGGYGDEGGEIGCACDCCGDGDDKYDDDTDGDDMDNDERVVLEATGWGINDIDADATLAVPMFPVFFRLAINRLVFPLTREGRSIVLWREQKKEKQMYLFRNSCMYVCFVLRQGDSGLVTYS